MSSFPNRPDRNDRARRFRPWSDSSALESRDLPAIATILSALAPNPRLGAQVANSSIDTSPFYRVSTFRATFSGQFCTGPGRSSDQSWQIFFSGGGGSNSFLHGDLQMSLVRFEDASRPSVSIVAMIPKNVTSSGNFLGMDLEAVPGAVDRFGRPTLMNWTVNSTSSGTFTSSDGSGAVRIHYMPNRENGRFPSGGFNMLFKGTLGVNGVTNVLRNVSSVH